MAAEIERISKEWLQKVSLGGSTLLPSLAHMAAEIERISREWLQKVSLGGSTLLSSLAHMAAASGAE